ncbi:hypothetical protein H5410_050001 [Solanum commersonii]|uniref:C2H2-type domain-containing protein n=1 Tax=Solanum commersonii TaxID=4109 RepID=A0A9J5WWQ1_SOLCO|nr:hypothetical protein H5410_050001 [Solanum commersonii]
MKVTKMKRQDGVSIFQCIYCGRKFYSSQAIAAHTRCHFKDGWVQGTPQRKSFVLFFYFQHDSTLISSIPQHADDSTNAQQLPPSDLASSRKCQPQPPRPQLRLCDANTLCRFKASLTKKEEEVVLILLDFPEIAVIWFSNLNYSNEILI